MSSALNSFDGSKRVHAAEVVGPRPAATTQADSNPDLLVATAIDSTYTV